MPFFAKNAQILNEKEEWSRRNTFRQFNESVSGITGYNEASSRAAAIYKCFVVTNFEFSKIYPTTDVGKLLQ